MSTTRSAIFVITIVWLWLPKCLAQNWLIPYLLPQDYDSNTPSFPQDEDGNTLDKINVNSTIWVNRFQGADNDLSLETDMELCLKWSDERIRRVHFENPVPGRNRTRSVHYRLVRLTDIDAFYIPRVYFRNAYFTEQVRSIQRIEYMEVFPEQQKLKFCSRIRISFMCHFQLSNFPFDEQNCFMELESMGKWSRNITLTMDSIRMPAGNSQFRVREHVVGRCDPESIDPFNRIYNYPDFPYNLTVQSCAFARVQLVRHVGYYVIRYYAPTFLLTVLTMIENWIPTNGWPARVIFTCVVELTMKSVSIDAYDETTSRHVVSLYWWLWGCQMFIYLCLIEFAMALAWGHFVVDKKIAHAKNVESPDGHYFGKRGWYKAAGKVITRILRKIYGPHDFFADPINRNKVDYCGRVIFPSMYLFFVILYIIATFPPWGPKYRIH